MTSIESTGFPLVFKVSEASGPPGGDTVTVETPQPEATASGLALWIWVAGVLAFAFALLWYIGA